MTAHLRKFMIPLVIVLACAVMVFSQHAYAAFTASVTGDTNTFGSGTAFMTAKAADGSTMCTSVPSGGSIPATSSFTCTGSLGPAVTTATQTNTQSTLVGSGSVAFSSASIRALSCQPVAFTNTLRAAGPMLARGGVTWQAAGPGALSGSSAFATNGSDALATGVAAATGAQTFSMGIWFKTSTPQGGIAGWSNGTGATNDTQRDRMLYLDANGYLNWGTYGNNAYQIITGSTNVADGAWHYAVGTGSVVSGTGTISLYLDGNLVNTKSFTSTTSAQANTGYWRAGQVASNASGWNGAGQYFNGSLSNMTVFNQALAASDAASLYAAGSQGAYASRAQALGATDLWTFGNNRLTTTAMLPSGTAPCSHFDVFLNGLTAPYSSAVGQSVGITAANPNTAVTLTIGTKRNASYGAFDTGLHMLLPLVITENGFTQTFTWNAMETLL